MNAMLEKLTSFEDPEKLRKVFSVSNNVSYLVQEIFLRQLKYSNRALKVKTASTFVDFAFFSC